MSHEPMSQQVRLDQRFFIKVPTQQRSIGITIWGLKIERRNTNQCLSGIRIKDQGVQSAQTIVTNYAQTFLLKSFFFLQPPRKHDDQSAFKKVLNSDRGFGAASRTLETKMVMYIITAKLNLTVGTTGKATAVKRLQKKWSVETRAVA